MAKATKAEKLGVLWSHNNEKQSPWLVESSKACKKQGFVWWDVGWRIQFDRFVFPITGYIWTTANQQVTHETLIGHRSKTIRQPDKVLAKQVEANWQDLGLPFSTNDPLHQYLGGERKTLTLLELLEIKELTQSKKLDDFKLWNGRPVLRPPQGVCRVTLP